MQTTEQITSGQIRAIWTICLRELKWTRDEVHERIGKDSVKDLTRVEAGEFLSALNEALGNKMRAWYRACRERFFLPANVKSFDPITKAQMNIIIVNAGIVFEQNLERFRGFLQKRFRLKTISIKKQAQSIINALMSMSGRS